MHPQSRRAAVFTSAVALSAALLTGCSGGDPEPAADPVTIGWLLPETGPLASVGADMREAFQLYLDVHDGRIGGRDVEMIVADEGTSPKEALESLDTLLAAKPSAVAGIATAAAFDAVVPTIQEANVPFLGTGERPVVVGSAVPEGLWQLSWTTYEPGAAAAEHLASDESGSTFVIGSNDLSGREQADSFIDAFKQAGGAVANLDGEPALVGSGDLAAQLSNAAASGATSIYAAFSGERAVDFLSRYDQSPAAGIPLYGAFLTEEPLLDEHGRRAEGVYSVANYYSTIDNGANRDFVAQWASHYRGQPNAYALAAWDAAIVLDKALERIPSDEAVTPDRLAQAIGGVGEIDSPRGPWRFSETTHAPVQRWYLRQVTKEGPMLVNTLIEQLATLG